MPSKECVAAIARHGPIVECGAGTGYWSAILQHSGVDVVAYDAEPPSAESNNSFFDSTFTQVRRGHGPSLFASAEAAALCQRALLLVWPNNADVSDNRHLLGNAGLREEGVDAAPLWDADCLKEYVETRIEYAYSCNPPARAPSHVRGTRMAWALQLL